MIFSTYSTYTKTYSGKYLNHSSACKIYLSDVIRKRSKFHVNTVEEGNRFCRKDGAVDSGYSYSYFRMENLFANRWKLSFIRLLGSTI